jgi:large subunit ribosomal protein L4
VTMSVTIQHPVANGDGSTDDPTQAIELPAEIFDVDANVALIHQVVVGQLAAARQGTHSTKTRAEVRGGGRKPYRQKGTGRARQGSTRAPQFAGGGIVHGPHPRDYTQRTPKKMKPAALRQALSDRARNGRVHVVSSLVAGGSPSTRDAAASLLAISSAKHILVVAGREDGVSWKSLRNIDTAHLIEPGQLNTYDVLISDDVVFTQEALEQFIEERGNGATLTITEVDATTKATGTATSLTKTAEVVEVPVDAVVGPATDADADTDTDDAVDAVDDDNAKDES